MESINSKTVAIIAHITLLGWIIAVVLNSNNKTEFGSFYLRQTLVLNIVLSLAFSTFLGKIIALVAFVFLILSLLGALTGDKKLVPFIGNEFQSWFRGL